MFLPICFGGGFQELTEPQYQVMMAMGSHRIATSAVVTVVTVVELNCSVGAPGYFTLIVDKAPSSARGSIEVVRA